jgi:hypothetical protein
MRLEVGSVIEQVEIYLKIARNVTKIDVKSLDMNRVKIPLGVFNRVDSQII